MGSWTTGTLGAIGLAGDLAVNVGNLVLGAQNTEFNHKLADLQAQALQLNLQLQKDSLNLSKEWNDPTARYEKALKAGYDPISARQLAGGGFVHFSGGVAMHPIKSADAINLKYSNMADQGLTAGRAYTNGVGRTTRPTDFYHSAWLHQDGQDAFTGGDWRPASSSWNASIRSMSSTSSGSSRLSIPTNWGSISTRSTQPSIPSWAGSVVSSSPSSIRLIPGSATTNQSQVG